MTEAQREMLKKFGNDCVCIDGTHGINSYDFELITLLVIDDIRQGFPCSFLISNRSDKEVLRIFYFCIQSAIGDAVPAKVFMSDMAEAFFNAWLEVMPAPLQRLFCTWHVDRAWRKNLIKVKTKEKQVEVYKRLRIVLQERDVAAFTIMIAEFYKYFIEDSDCVDFGNYFKHEYMNKVTCWAYCYRLGAGINTNMHLERMHKSLKYTYLKGKNVERLDKGISAIMRLLRNKCIDRLIVLNKGKVSSKLQSIRSRHKVSKDLDVNLIIPCENGWNVASSKMTELYLIQVVKEKCDCRLICTECETCMHRYCCSCIDSSIKYNMCKHIHLLCKFLNQNEPTENATSE